MKELEILENQSTREGLIEKVDVLDKVKELVLLPYGDCMTTQQVADYYEVPIGTIKSLVSEHIKELEVNGYKTLEKDDLKEFKGGLGNPTTLKYVSALGIFLRRTILDVGMLLRDSEVAKEIRTQLLNMSEDESVIQETINNIDKEKLLALDVIYATDDNSRILALSKLNTYKDEQRKKIEDERDQAIIKVENITKSDATYGIREAKNNIGCGEKKFTTYLVDNKYCYRTGKNNKLKPYAHYTLEPTRYFTEITQLDRLQNPHNQMVLTIDGLEYFRELKDKINK